MALDEADRVTPRRILSLLLVLSLAGAGGGLAELYRQLREAREDVQELARRRMLVGSDTPSWLMRQMPASDPRWDFRRPSMILIIGRNSCLTCLTELARWDRLFRIGCPINVGAVVVGESDAFAERLKREEGLVMPVLADSSGSLTQELGISLEGSLRLGIVRGQVGVVADGGDGGPVGFPEVVEATLRSGGGATDVCVSPGPTISALQPLSRDWRIAWQDGSLHGNPTRP